MAFSEPIALRRTKQSIFLNDLDHNPALAYSTGYRLIQMTGSRDYYWEWSAISSTQSEPNNREIFRGIQWKIVGGRVRVDSRTQSSTSDDQQNAWHWGQL